MATKAGESAVSASSARSSAAAESGVRGGQSSNETKRPPRRSAMVGTPTSLPAGANPLCRPRRTLLVPRRQGFDDMRYGSRLVLLATTLMTLLALAPGLARSDGMLVATVGPGFDISLTGADGQPVTNLPAGTYTITVHDRSEIHDFHLSGPGVDQATDIDGSGDATWTVTLQ